MRPGKTIFTLKTKLAFLFLSLALVPLVIIGAYAIHTTERLIVDLVLRQLENAAVDKAALLERWLGERKADMQVLADTSLVKTMDPGMIAPYFTLIKSKYGVYKDIAVIGDNGALIFSTQGTDLNVALQAWEHTATPETLYLSEIAYLPEATESTFHIAAPVFLDGTMIGAVYGTVGTSKIIYSILNVALGLTGECYLVDKNGAFLAHKEPHRILTENISQSESFKNISGGRDQKKTYLDYRGIEVLGKYRKVAGTDWYLVVEQDRDEAFASVDALRRYLYVTVFLCISSAFVLTWIIARHFVNPIRALAKSADDLAGSQTDGTSLQITRQDEIGVLCRAFENMALKVRERQDNLEQKVSLKEAELKEIDLTLKQIKVIAERSEKFAAIGRLGAAVAHEIRTPLTSIKLFLESAQAEIEISTEYEEDFFIALEQIKRIEAAINRLLDFTKPQDLVFAPICIAQLVQDVVFMMRPMANKQVCDLDVRVEKDLPMIEGDKRFLEEALVNLMINALEAIAENGKISIRVAKDHFETDGRTATCIRLDVRDNGHGISADSMKLLFEPFYTTKSSGTGLGLPLVYHTIQRHGGQIRVNSPSEDGTVFSLYFPLQTAYP